MFSSRKVPVIHQSEISECGLACLNMIAIYHGHSFPMSYLRKHFPSRVTGTKLRELMDIATEIGFYSRAVRVERHELKNIQLPCILHWDVNHYVVLSHIKKNGFIINDPSSGRRFISNDEFDRSYTGISLEVTPNLDIEKIKIKNTTSILNTFNFTKDIKRAFIHIFIMSLALEVMLVLTPMITQIIIDSVFLTSDTSLLTTVVIGSVIILLTSTLITSVRSITVINLSSYVSLTWLNSLFTHLINLPMKFFHSREYGEISSRFNSLHTIQKTVTDFFITAILDGVMSLLTLALMFLYSPIMTAISLSGLAIYVALRYTWYSYLYVENEKLLRISAQEENHFVESIKGIQTIKTNNVTGDRKEAWMDIVTSHNNSSIKLQKMSVLYTATNSVIIGIEGIIILWVGANQVITNEFSIGMYLAFIAYSTQFSSRIGNLIDSFMSLKLMKLHIERISDITDHPQEHEHHKLGFHKEKDQKPKPSIEFNNVYFKYNENDKWILEDLSFKVGPGEKVVITGPNGSGKSTILKLIEKIYLPQRGKILIDGVDINHIPTVSLRNIISSIFQNDYIFSGTIIDNICLMNDSYDDIKVNKISNDVNALDFIMKLPLGFHTPINSTSLSLSSGQQQKILFARALYRNPKILILDEATSNLDRNSEIKINSLIKSSNITTIMVAHKNSVIESADRVIYID